MARHPLSGTSEISTRLEYPAPEHRLHRPLRRPRCGQLHSPPARAQHHALEPGAGAGPGIHVAPGFGQLVAPARHCPAQRMAGARHSAIVVVQPALCQHPGGRLHCPRRLPAAPPAARQPARRPGIAAGVDSSRHHRYFSGQHRLPEQPAPARSAAGRRLAGRDTPVLGRRQRRHRRRHAALLVAEQRARAAASQGSGAVPGNCRLCHPQPARHLGRLRSGRRQRLQVLLSALPAHHLGLGPARHGRRHHLGLAAPGRSHRRRPGAALQRGDRGRTADAVAGDGLDRLLHRQRGGRVAAGQ